MLYHASRCHSHPSSLHTCIAACSRNWGCNKILIPLYRSFPGKAEGVSIAGSSAPLTGGADTSTSKSAAPSAPKARRTMSSDIHSLHDAIAGTSYGVLRHGPPLCMSQCSWFASRCSNAMSVPYSVALLSAATEMSTKILRKAVLPEHWPLCRQLLP